MSQDVNVFQLSGNFDQIFSKRDKYSSSSTRVKSSSKLSSNIVPPDYSAINISSISDNWVKRGQPKVRAVEVYKRDMR